MSGYEGQPEHVCVGVQKDLLRHWVVEKRTLPSDEWGRAVEAGFGFLDALDDHEMEVAVAAWIWEELIRWHDDDWYDDWEHERVREIRAAQEEYMEVVEYWRDRAKSFNGSTPETKTVASDALEETLAALPEWIAPDPDAEPLPDPEREQYDRLRAKFE